MIARQKACRGAMLRDDWPRAYRGAVGLNRIRWRRTMVVVCKQLAKSMYRRSYYERVLSIFKN